MKKILRFHQLLLIALALTVPAAIAADNGLPQVLPALTTLLFAEDQRIDSLSHEQASPGTFIAIVDRSIQQDQPLEVQFFDALGFDLKLTTYPLVDGEVRVPVPVYRDPDSDEFGRGEVTVRLPNGDRAPLTILDLPVLPETSVVPVMEAYLEAHRANFAEYLLVLNEVHGTYGLDASDQIALIQDKVAELDGELNELQTLGTLVHKDVAQNLSEEELRLYARLIYAMSKGLVDEINRAATELAAPAQLSMISGAVPASAGTSEDTITRMATDFTAEAFAHQVGDGVQNRSKTADSVVVHLGSMAREYGGAWGEDKFNSTVGVRAHAVPKILAGSAHTLGNLLHAAKYGHGFSIDHRLLEGLDDISDDILPDEVKEFMEMYRKAESLRLWAARNCKTGIDVQGFKLYCDGLKNTRIEDSAEYSRLSFARFDPYRLESGSTGVLKLYVSAREYIDNPASMNTVTIDWKDGSPRQVLTLIAGTANPLGAYAYAEVPHTYTLTTADPDEVPFPIDVSVVGNNYNHIDTRRANVVVQQRIDPLYSEVLEAPNCLDVDETGDWKFGIRGGIKPYHVSLHWGDGSPFLHRWMSPSAGGIVAPHAYTTPGIYTVTLKVTSTSTAGTAEKRDFTTTVRVEPSCANDLPSVSVTASDSEASEVASEANTGSYRLQRTGPTDSTLSVGFSMSGSADIANDYTLAGTGEIPRGSSTTGITLNPIEDLNVEGTESATLTLSAGNGYLVGSPAFAHVLIRDADVHACADGSISYTHSEYRCARFWGCDGSVRFIKNGNLICYANSYEEITASSIDYYDCNEPNFNDCVLANSTVLTGRDDWEGGYTLFWNDGANWMYVEELD